MNSYSVIHDKEAESKSIDVGMGKLVSVPALPSINDIGQLLASVTDEVTDKNFKKTETMLVRRSEDATHVFEAGLSDGFTVEDIPGIYFAFKLNTAPETPSFDLRVIHVAVSSSTIATLVLALQIEAAQQRTINDMMVKNHRIAQAEKTSIMAAQREAAQEAATWKDLANKTQLLCNYHKSRADITTAAVDTLSHVISLYAGEDSWQKLDGEEVSRVLVGSRNGYEIASKAINDVSVKAVLAND